MGLNGNPQAASAMAYGVAAAAIPQPAGGAPHARSQRQQVLDALWAHYRCEHYATRTTDWNGHPVLGQTEHEVVATTQALPPGFTDPGGALLPLKFRKPSSPYHLGRVIVDRFTGLLFSQRKHPKVTVDGDPDTEDWLNGVVEAIAALAPDVLRFCVMVARAVTGLPIPSPAVDTRDAEIAALRARVAELAAPRTDTGARSSTTAPARPAPTTPTWPR